MRKVPKEHDQINPNSGVDYNIKEVRGHKFELEAYLAKTNVANFHKFLTSNYVFEILYHEFHVFQCMILPSVFQKIKIIDEFAIFQMT